MIRKKNVLPGDIRSFAERRVIGSDRVGLQAVQIVRAAQHLMFHVPLRKNRIVKLLRIAVLLVANEKRGAFL